jgi:hypothetical protein
MGRIYISSPIDEVQLARKAQPHVDGLNGRMPTVDDLATLSKSHDIDLASMVFHEAVRCADDNKAFVDAVDAQDVGRTTNTPITMLVLPALFYEEHPEVGGDGAQIISIARACGIDARLVPTNSCGGIDDDLPIIIKALQDVTEGEIWIMTISKGAAEWCCLLREHADEIPLDRITTWFNVGGLPRGAHINDVMTSSRVRRIKTRALCKVIHMDYRSFCEFGTDSPRLKEPLQTPEHLRVINVIGTPLTCHVEKSMQTRFRMLKHLGPNDGMVLLPWALWLPGYVYPVLGADHFFRGSHISSIVYRLFAFAFDEPGQKKLQTS